MIDIKDTSGKIRFSTPINKGSKRKFLLMKEDYIILKFSLDKPVYFHLGDGIDNELGVFELVDLYKPAYNRETGGYDYELRLDAYYWKWKNKKNFYIPEVGRREASWSLTATLDMHMKVFLRNLKQLGYTHRNQDFDYVMDSTVDGSAKMVSYDNVNLMDALSQMAEAWGCEWWIDDSIIHFGRCEYSSPVDFEIDSNVEEMTCSDSRTTYATRIYAFGSTKNLPPDYRPVEESAVANGVVQKRLMLPSNTPYIDASPEMNVEEAIEEIVVFEDVYPHRVGTMSGITTHEYTDKIEEEGKAPVFKKWNAYRFKDAGLTFSEDYVLPGQELKIIFQSGAMNGMSFVVWFNPYDKDKNEKPQPEKNANGNWNPLAQVFEIVRNEDYGRPIPDESLQPSNGDKYVLYGFDTKFVSDTMLPDAEQELLERATKYVEKSKIDPSTYTCKMMSDWVYADPSKRTFTVGDKVNLINKTYFDEGRLSRIIGYEYCLDIPSDNPIYTVGETAAYSRLGAIESKVDSLTFKGQSYFGTGVAGSGSSVYVIGVNDKTLPSDRNTFSAKRILNEIKERALSRIGDDSASGLITFLNGLSSLNGMDVVGGIATDTLTATEITTQILNALDKLIAKDATFSDDVSSADYAEKLLGWMINASGDIDAKSLRLRDFLEVPEFRYNRVSIVSGESWNAPGGGIVEAVDTVEGILYLKLEPGERADVEADDICKASFNDETGFRTAYFRITEKLGDTAFKYVLRSETTFHPCKAMHFVSYGNFTNADRQKSSYSAQNYVRYLTGVNGWEIRKEMIAMQLGDLSNLKLFGIDMTGHSAYLRNIYMTGVIRQLSDDGVTESRVPCFKGEWTEGDYYHYDEVTHLGSIWLCISEVPTAQEPTEGATDWLEKSAKGKDAVSIHIISSNGTVFQNDSEATTLTAYVIKGEMDITDSILQNHFSWERKSKYASMDEVFNETHVGHGHVLELASSDLVGCTTFDCIVLL